MEETGMGKQYSRRELIAIAMRQGWTPCERRGKGSHILMTKDGERPFPIPHRLSPAVHDEIKKRLNLND